MSGGNSETFFQRVSYIPYIKYNYDVGVRYINNNMMKNVKHAHLLHLYYTLKGGRKYIFSF